MALDPDITNAFDQIPYPTHELLSLQLALHRIIAALSSPERERPVLSDPRVEIYELDGVNIGEIVQSIRDGMIGMGVAKAHEPVGPPPRD